MTKTQLYAREGVAFDETAEVKDAAGNVVDLSGYALSLAMFKAPEDAVEFTLTSGVSAGTQGLHIVEGGLRIVIDKTTLEGVGDDTGEFELFGDLLGDAAGGTDYRFIADVRLNCTVAGRDFKGATFKITLDAVSNARLAEIEALIAEVTNTLPATQPELDETGFATKTRNLFDPAAEDVQLAVFVNESTGTLDASANYNTSGIFPIEAGAEYAHRGIVRGVWLDAAEQFVSGFGPLGASDTVTAPATARFARVSALAAGIGGSNANWHNAQFEKAGAATDFVGFEEKIDPWLVPGADAFNQRTLRKWHIFQRNIALGRPAQFDIALIGNSYTHNPDRYSGAFAEALVDLYGDAGGGWVGFANNGGGSGLNGNARPGIYTLVRTGSWSIDSTNYISSPSPDIGRAESSTAGDRLTLTGPAAPALSGAKLFWEGTADGVIRYSWDEGVSWTPLNVQGGVGTSQTAALTGFTSGTWTLWIEVVSGTVHLQGVNLASEASGVRVHKLGATGSQAAQWANVDGTQWQAAIGALAPDMVMVIHGRNDQANSRTPALFAAAVETIMTRVRAAVPGVDRMVVAYPENQAQAKVRMPSYSRVLAGLCVRHRMAFKDAQPAYGDPNNAEEYGSAGDLRLFSADNEHPVTRAAPTAENLWPNAVVLHNELLHFLGAEARRKSFTVATLPPATAGDRSFVTDASATAFASVVAGGGSNRVPVYFDGSDWRIG